MMNTEMIRGLSNHALTAATVKHHCEWWGCFLSCFVFCSSICPETTLDVNRQLQKQQIPDPWPKCQLYAREQMLCGPLSLPSWSWQKSSFHGIFLGGSFLKVIPRGPLRTHFSSPSKDVVSTKLIVLHPFLLQLAREVSILWYLWTHHHTRSNS